MPGNSSRRVMLELSASLALIATLGAVGTLWFIRRHHEQLLAKAIDTRNLTAIRHLSLQDLDVNLTSPRGDTALQVAAGNGDRALVSRLLARGANLETAFRRSLEKSDARAAVVLVENGAEVRTRRPNFEPIMNAAGLGDPVLMRAMLANGASPTRADALGRTPLLVALEHYDDPRYGSGLLRLAKQRAAKRHLDTVQALLEHHADPNARDKSGRTALWLAVITHYEGAIKLLLASGADPALQGPDGETPLALAKRQNYRWAVKVLSHPSARPNDTKW